MGGAAQGVDPDDRKKSRGGLCPHALTAITRTHALNPGGRPPALTVVFGPTLVGGATFEAPCVDPAEMM